MGMKSVKANYFDTNGVADEIGNVLKKYSRKAEEDFQKTIETWNRKSEVVFKKEIRQRGRRIIAEVYTEDDIYRFINDGTSVRHAVMSEGFRPKTKRGVLKSFPGRGGVANVSKQIIRPGIKARNFTKAITKKHGKNFIADIQRAAADGADTRVKKAVVSIANALNKLKRLL